MKAMMIQPILPTLPRTFINPSADTTMTILTYTAFLMLAAVTAFLISLYASGHFKGDKKKTAFVFTGIALVVSALLLCFFGCAVSAVKGALFCLILVFCSYSDIKTRESDDYLALMIALTAFIGTEVTDIPGMLLSGVLITLPMLLILIVCKGKVIGGADIKLSAACAFLLGIWNGTAGLMLGLTLGIIINLIVQMKKDKTEGFPLIPYLAVGFMTAYFI